jgi:hypothetical protein
LNNHARVDVEATENPKRSGIAFRSSTTEKSFRPDDDLHTDDLHTDDLAVNAKDKDEHYYDSDEHAAQVTILRISLPAETFCFDNLLVRQFAASATFTFDKVSVL